MLWISRLGFKMNDVWQQVLIVFFIYKNVLLPSCVTSSNTSFADDSEVLD